MSSKLTELLAEIASEEGLDENDVAALLDAVRRRKEAADGGEQRALARRRDEDEPPEFPVGPNHARAIERRAPGRLAIGHAHERGVQMYGRETAAQAYERWMEQEQADPEGVYGAGGGTAGGIFGDGPVHMPDYDPAARRRTEAAQGGAAMARLGVVLERLLDRVEALESGSPKRALPAQPPRRLRGK
jgi:hypothetical protein